MARMARVHRPRRRALGLGRTARAARALGTTRRDGRPPCMCILPRILTACGLAQRRLQVLGRGWRPRQVAALLVDAHAENLELHGGGRPHRRCRDGRRVIHGARARATKARGEPQERGARLYLPDRRAKQGSGARHGELHMCLLNSWREGGCPRSACVAGSWLVSHCMGGGAKRAKMDENGQRWAKTHDPKRARAGGEDGDAIVPPSVWPAGMRHDHATEADTGVGQLSRRVARASFPMACFRNTRFQARVCCPFGASAGAGSGSGAASAASGSDSTARTRGPSSGTNSGTNSTNSTNSPSNSPSSTN